MAASWKYFALRTVNAFIVLAVVIFIIAAVSSTLADQQLRSDIRTEVRGHMQEVSRENPGLSEEDLNEERARKTTELEERYGLDKPLWERIVTRTYNTLKLDFGKAQSMRDPRTGSQEVWDVIMSRLPRTILLFTTAAALYTILGLIVGLKAAQVAGSYLDKGLSLFGITMSSMPMWWLGMIAILIFAYELEWFPAAAFPFPEETGWQYYKGVLWRMVLPLSVIVTNLFGGRAWATRNLVTEVLQDDYIMAARAKGVPERKVIYGHTLKTAAPPIVTSAILTFLLSIGGAMITEIIFNWPGMGRLLWVALQQNDVPVVIGIVFISTFMYVLGYLIADLIYGFLDPRVEVGAEKAV
ncbi:MAG: ABC transporter permease [Thermoplasmata archaeon]